MGMQRPICTCIRIYIYLYIYIYIYICVCVHIYTCTSIHAIKGHAEATTWMMLLSNCFRLGVTVITHTQTHTHAHTHAHTHTHGIAFESQLSSHCKGGVLASHGDCFRVTTVKSLQRGVLACHNAPRLLGLSPILMQSHTETLSVMSQWGLSERASFEPL